MTRQLSDCCKADIILTGKDRPEAFACKKCGRIIGTPTPKEDKNIEDIISDFVELYSETFDVDSAYFGENPKNLIRFLRLSLQKYGEKEYERGEIEGYVSYPAKSELYKKRIQQAKEQIKEELIKKAPKERYMLAVKKCSTHKRDDHFTNTRNMGFNECREQFLDIIRNI